MYTLSLYDGYRILGSAGPIELLISLAQQPLEEMRVSVFAVLESIATHEWGQRELTQSTKFLDYILNRTTESTHAGKVKQLEHLFILLKKLS